MKLIASERGKKILIHNILSSNTLSVLSCRAAYFGGELIRASSSTKFDILEIGDNL